jgi:excisionase family DNA binding protein
MIAAEQRHAFIGQAGKPGLRPLLTAQEVAELFGVSRAWVLAHANGNRRPRLPSVKLGKAVRFQTGAVERFLQECTR